MTREEQRAKAAHEYIQSDSVPAGNETLAFGDFIEGAKWADSHPKWIPVKKELPKHDVEENGLITYQEVLVSLYDGYVGTDTYDTQLKAWWQYEGEVEYWMPMPQPPRKEE